MNRSGAYVMIGHAKRSNAIYLNTLKRLKNEDIKSSHSLNNVCKYIAFDLFAGPIITYDPLLFRDLRYPPGFSSSRFSFHLLTLSTFSKWISLPCLAQHTTLPNNSEISEYLSVLSYLLQKLSHLKNPRASCTTCTDCGVHRVVIHRRLFLSPQLSSI